MSESDVEVVRVCKAGVEYWAGRWCIQYRRTDIEHSVFSAYVTAPDEVGAIAEFYKRRVKGSISMIGGILNERE